MSLLSLHGARGLPVSLTLGLVALLAGCKPAEQAAPPAASAPASAVVVASAPDMHNAANAIDWAGTYSGTVPCASCPGILTWLELQERDGKVHYRLSETYLEKKDGHVQQEGEAQWTANGSVLELGGKDERRALFVGEGFVEWLGEGQTQPRGDNSPYMLHKYAAYTGGGQQLLVQPSRIRVVGHQLQFDGLMNFDTAAQGGHRSLRADFVVDCKKNEVDMPKVAYYSAVQGGGKRLHEAKDNAGNWTPFAPGSQDPVAQLAKAYCPG